VMRSFTTPQAYISPHHKHVPQEAAAATQGGLALAPGIGACIGAVVASCRVAGVASCDALAHMTHDPQVLQRPPLPSARATHKHWCRLVANACSRGLTSSHFSAGPSLAQPWQRGRLQRPAAVLRQPLLSCFSVVAHRAGARARGAALPHRLSAARTLTWPSRVFSFSLKHKHRPSHRRASARPSTTPTTRPPAATAAAGCATASRSLASGPLPLACKGFHSNMSSARAKIALVLAGQAVSRVTRARAPRTCVAAISRSPLFTVLDSSMAMVMGPTPPARTQAQPRHGRHAQCSAYPRQVAVPRPPLG
jgi:hypothetical protein